MAFEAIRMFMGTHLKGEVRKVAGKSVSHIFVRDEYTRGPRQKRKLALPPGHDVLRAKGITAARKTACAAGFVGLSTVDAGIINEIDLGADGRVVVNIYPKWQTRCFDKSGKAQRGSLPKIYEPMNMDSGDVQIPYCSGQTLRVCKSLGGEIG